MENRNGLLKGSAALILLVSFFAGVNGHMISSFSQERLLFPGALDSGLPKVPVETKSYLSKKCCKIKRIRLLSGCSNDSVEIIIFFWGALAFFVQRPIFKDSLFDHHHLPGCTKALRTQAIKIDPAGYCYPIPVLTIPGNSVIPGWLMLLNQGSN